MAGRRPPLVYASDLNLLVTNITAAIAQISAMRYQ